MLSKRFKVAKGLLADLTDAELVELDAEIAHERNERYVEEWQGRAKLLDRSGVPKGKAWDILNVIPAR